MSCKDCSSSFIILIDNPDFKTLLEFHNSDSRQII